MKIINRIKWFLIAVYRSARAYAKRMFPRTYKPVVVPQMPAKTIAPTVSATDAYYIARAKSKRERRRDRNIDLAISGGLKMARCA
jgi:hypothetical protein